MSTIDRNSDLVNDNCKLTAKEVNTIAYKVFKDSSVKVLSFSLKPISEEKLGFTASHQYLEIVYKKNKSTKPETLNLFVKAVQYDNAEQLEMVQENGIFDEEVTFFAKIFPWLNDIYRGEKWCPTVYMVKKDAMIMEELKSQGFKLRGNFMDQAPVIKATLQALARFHSCSIVAEAVLERLNGKPKTLAEHYPGNFSEKLFSGKTEGAGKWIAAGVNVTAFVAEHLGLESSKLRKSFDKLQELVKPSTKHRNVICHGDLWTNNMMFDDTEPQPRCILVDFQIIRYAPHVLDILHFLYVNTSKSWRDEHEKELVEHYYDTLERHVRLNDETKSARMPTLEETFEAYNELRVFGSCNANLYMPFILMDKKIIAERMEKEGFAGCVFGDRTQQTVDYMAKDDFYRARIEENVRELVELSERMH